MQAARRGRVKDSVAGLLAVLLLILGAGSPPAHAAGKPARKPALKPVPPRLEPIQIKAGTLRGVVKSHMGKPLPRTSVELLDAKGKSVARTVTGSRGEYVLQNVAPGKYTVVVGGKSRLPITMTREATVSRLLIVPRHAAGVASSASAGASSGFLGLGTWAWVAIGGGVAAAVAIPLAAGGGGGGGGGGPVSP